MVVVELLLHLQLPLVVVPPDLLDTQACLLLEDPLE